MGVLKNNKKILMFLLVLTIVSISFLSENQTKEKSKNIIKLTNSGSISNKKIGWGIKRANNHEQPDLGKSNIKILQQNNGIAMGNAETKKIYLTFDEGYEAGYTSHILQTLKEENVKATFFITAHYVNTSSDLVEQMIKEGHIIRKSYSKT